MIIIFYDGSRLECNEIEIAGEGLTGMTLIADGYRIVPIVEVLRIVSA